MQELLTEADRQIAMSTIKRPTAADVQAIWREVLELLEDATEAERKTLLSRFVRKVEVTDKNKASLQIVGPIAGTLDGKFALHANMGAGTRNTNTFINPSKERVPLFVPSGGRNRKRVPRSACQAQTTLSAS